jgi:hypothetical protein
VSGYSRPPLLHHPLPVGLLRDTPVPWRRGVKLGQEQNLDRRTIRKRIKRAIERLRDAEKELP